jgi:hypothetical protein
MKQLLSDLFLRMPQRSIGLAAFWAVMGCIWVVLSISGFISHAQGIVSKSGYLMLALIFFINTGFYALPDHWRRAKIWLRVAGLLLALVLLSMLILMFIGARQGQSI